MNMTDDLVQKEHRNLLVAQVNEAYAGIVTDMYGYARFFAGVVSVWLVWIHVGLATVHSYRLPDQQSVR